MPLTSDNIVERITRATLISLAREDLHLEVVVRLVDPSELRVAEEVFVCWTGAEVSPVIEIDKRSISDGAPRQLTQQLQYVYFASGKAVHLRHREGLTPVR